MKILESTFYRGRDEHPYIKVKTDIKDHWLIVFTLLETDQLKVQILEMIEGRDVFKYQTWSECCFRLEHGKEPWFIPFLQDVRSRLPANEDLYRERACKSIRQKGSSGKRSLINELKTPVE